MSFARFVLGIHKKAPNAAVLGDLWRYPLGLELTVHVSSILYLKHLMNKKANALLKEAVLCNSTSWIQAWEELVM